MPRSPHRLRNDLKCVEWDVKPCSIQSNIESRGVHGVYGNPFCNFHEKAISSGGSRCADRIEYRPLFRAQVCKGCKYVGVMIHNRNYDIVSNKLGSNGICKWTSLQEGNEPQVMKSG